MSRTANSPPIWRTLLLAGAIAFMEPISATMLFPFVYFMVRSFNPNDEQHVGLRAGLITSAFFVPQMITTVPWGIASDRYGRRPILLAGLIGSAVFFTLFGLSQSFVWAVLSRGMCGVFNGNTPLTRTVAGELADRTGLDHSKAFAIFGLTQALGYAVGPMIGGILADPYARFGWEGPGAVFVRFPYLLPCIIGTGLILFVTAATAIGLDETNPAILARRKEESTRLQPGESVDGEMEPLIGSEQAMSRHERPMAPLVAPLLGVTLLALHAIAFDEGFPVFAASMDSDNYPVGLGFSSSQIALALSTMAPVLVSTQLFGYPLARRQFSDRALWRASALTFVVVYPGFSVLPHLKRTRWMWPILLLLLASRFVANVAAYTSAIIILNELAPARRKGAAMSLLQTGISLGRTIGPALGGAIWSWSLSNGLPFPLDSHVFFFFLAALAAVQGMTYIWISRVSEPRFEEAYLEGAHEATD